MAQAAQGADKWTYVSAGSEAILSVIANFFWVALNVDLIAELEADTPIGVSKVSAAVAALIAVLASSGSVYCHYMLNLRHQHADGEESNKASNDPAPLASDSASTPLLATALGGRLSVWQWMALAGDWFGHAGEFAATLSFIFNLATKNALLSREITMPVNIGLAVLGTIFSWADVRTCKQNLRDCNKKMAAAQTTFRNGINNSETSSQDPSHQREV